MLTAALGGDVGAACRSLAQLQRLGYSAEDVLGVVLRVARALDAAEGARLALLREAARAHLRAADGLASPLQLAAMLARMCRAGTASAASADDW